MEEKDLIAAKERKDIRRSLLHLSFVFFLIYTPYRCLECIQSSLNFEEGLGALSIGVLQGGNFVSCLLVGAPFVYAVGPKWSLFISFFAHTLFIIANYYPTLWTMMPSSILVGVMSAIIWVSQGTYVTILAQRYAECSKQDLIEILPKFSAVFHLFWGASSPVGNLLASLVLGYHHSETQDNCSNHYLASANTNRTRNEEVEAHLNYSLVNTSDTSDCGGYPRNTDYCGVNHCPYMSEHLEVLQKPSETLVYILMSAFLIFNLLGVVLCAFIKPLNTPRNSSARKKLIKTVMLVKNPNLIFMIVPFILVGMLPGMFYSNFAQSFASCVFGIGMVGYALMCEGLGFAAACLICGPITRIIPRQVQFTFVFISLIAISITWMLWTPSGDEFWVVIVISSAYGLMHGLHRTHLSALTSLLFPQDPEPAFAHYHLGRTLALSVTFIISPHMCFAAKNYMFLATVCVAAVSFMALELRLHCCKEDTDEEISKDVTVTEQMVKNVHLDLSKAHKLTLGSVASSLGGSLSGSCTNVNIQS